MLLCSEVLMKILLLRRYLSIFSFEKDHCHKRKDVCCILNLYYEPDLIVN